jgi:hypothetical protein
MVASLSHLIRYLDENHVCYSSLRDIADPLAIYHVVKILKNAITGRCCEQARDHVVLLSVQLMALLAKDTMNAKRMVSVIGCCQLVELLAATVGHAFERIPLISWWGECFSQVLLIFNNILLFIGCDLEDLRNVALITSESRMLELGVACLFDASFSLS